MMGAGKSTVGGALARRLGWSLLDSDAMVEARTGHTVAEIFAEEGEAAFRAEESAVLAVATGSAEPVVIAAAGGAVLDPANRRIIADAGFVVWLRAAAHVLAGRVHPGDHRPLLAGDPPNPQHTQNPQRTPNAERTQETLARLAREREPFYAELADLVIDVDQGTPDGTVEAIVQAIAAEARG